MNAFNFLLLLFFCSVFVNINGNRIKDLNKIEEHIHSKEHNPQVDHEAFLGEEESKAYDNLTEEESKNRLRNLVLTKVDLDGDKFVTEVELKQWIKHISILTKEKERDNMFKVFSNSSDGFVEYDAYFNRTYGPFKANELDDISKENLEKMKLQDNRKWEMVDENKDNKLDKKEFLMFIHPEDYPKMRSLVIQETLEISDKNKDGFLDIEEYINDIWSPDSDIDQQPDQKTIDIERDTFKTHRDANKDGHLDGDEIGEWLMPTNYDAAEAETQHLIHNADVDRDGRLSVEEIVESHEVFAGSQATDYGNSLKHEEL